MSPYHGRRVAVWGAARTGIAAANLLVELGASVLLSDPREDPDLSGLDAQVCFEGGGNCLGDAQLLLPSPGIPPSTLALQEALAQGALLLNELDLAASVAQAPIIAISGTDGKSSTTEMIGAALRGAGRRAIVAGNIGVPFSARVSEAGPQDFLVIEVSAFQLWSCRDFKPRVAVLCNIAEDHIEYFKGDRLAYAKAKLKVFEQMGTEDTAILRADELQRWGELLPAEVRRWSFSSEPRAQGWSLSKDQLCWDGRPQMSAQEVPVPGRHNQLNALSALAAGSALRLPISSLVEGLKSFKGLPHRLERIPTQDGLNWFNDSKATNPHAALTGLRSQDGPMVVIAGGYEKGLCLEAFAAFLRVQARHVVLLGQTSVRLAALLDNPSLWSQAQTMDEAVALAAQAAQPGDQVLLSPAASSFDLYTSYKARGEIFKAAVLLRSTANASL